MCPSRRSRGVSSCALGPPPRTSSPGRFRRRRPPPGTAVPGTLPATPAEPRRERAGDVTVASGIRSRASRSRLRRTPAMGDAVIVSTARTAIGTARKGTLLDVSAFDLAKYAAGEALERSGIDKESVDDLQMGEVLQGGGDIARFAAMELGLESVPGVALNRHCAS